MAQKQDISEENVEEMYENYKDFGNQVYARYEDTFKLMVSKLNASHLEPFAKILLERENVILSGQDELMESVKENLEKQMQKAFHNIWQANNVSEALISMEMLKEKFKAYEGQKWNLESKTPMEITRPMRMRFKENRSRYLQAQLNFQNKQLEEVLQENEALRQNLRDVKHQRTFLIENIEDSRKKIELGKAKIIDLQEKMQNIELNFETENKEM